MHTPLPTYLRAHRRRAGLTQDELGFLLGPIDPSEISRVERNRRPPNLRLVATTEMMFGVQGRDLFPEFYSRQERDLMDRLMYMYRVLQRRPRSEELDRKLQMLLRAATRVGVRRPK